MVRPTLVSIARTLGVSPQTVSNVVNSPELVSAKTRRRVEEHIKEVGYRPSAAAQALRMQRSLNLAMRLHPSTDGINGAVMDRFWHHIVAAAQRRGYRVTMIAADNASDEVASLVRLHETRTIDGVILTDTGVGDPRPRELAKASVPFAAFGRPWGDDHATHRWVDIDGAAGVRGATEHLLGTGLTRIGFLGWPVTSGVGDDRRNGWLQAMAAVEGFDPEPLNLATGDGVAEGVAAARQLLDAGAEAIVCASDSLAVGALGATTPLGRQIPVIGFDDTPVAQALGISSVAQPVEEAASRLIDGLLADLKKPGPSAGHQTLLSPTLVLREATIT